MDLPTLLRTERARRRMSQERAALAVGVTFYRYRRLETGMERPSEAEATGIGQVFGLTPRAVRGAVAATAMPRGGNGEAASVA